LADWRATVGVKYIILQRISDPLVQRCDQHDARERLHLDHITMLLRAARRAAGPRATLLRPLPTPPARRENTTLIVAGLIVSAGAVAAKAAVELQKKAQEAIEAAAEERKKNPSEEAAKATEEKADGGFAAWFDSAGRRHYEGPFESPMTRREAALILGVRETANAKRIKDAHRRIMRINHPDVGGSAFLTAKVNEAKEMLMKGKGS